jgi:hypothetical protein
MTTARTVGFTLRRASDRIKGRRKIAPVAKEAEAFVCRGLGIVQDGEEVTEIAMKEFASRFAGEVPEHVLAAMRALFRVQAQEDEDVDAAILSHGGAAGLELQEFAEGAAVDNV